MQGSSYVRAIVPGAELTRRGHHVSYIDQRNDPRMREADVIQCQRRIDAETLGTLWAIKDQYGIPFIHDIDDNFNALPGSNPMCKVLGVGTLANTIGNNYCARAALLTVSTPSLAREYADINSKVAILYNALDDVRLEQYAPKEITGEPKRKGEMRIGWAGSNTHRADIELVVPVLKRMLAEFDDLKIVFLGDDLRLAFIEKNCGCSVTSHFGLRPCKRHGRQLEYVGNTVNKGKLYPSIDFRSEDLMSLLFYKKLQSADFDIGIAPVVPNLFNEGKSYLKLLEYGMMGIPTIAQRFGSYVQYVQESSEAPVLLADSALEWEKGLRNLITDASLRKHLAEANLRYINSTHVISKRVHLWESAFEWAAGRLAPA